MGVSYYYPGTGDDSYNPNPSDCGLVHSHDHSNYLTGGKRPMPSVAELKQQNRKQTGLKNGWYKETFSHPQFGTVDNADVHYTDGEISDAVTPEWDWDKMGGGWNYGAVQYPHPLKVCLHYKAGKLYKAAKGWMGPDIELK